MSLTPPPPPSNSNPTIPVIDVSAMFDTAAPESERRRIARGVDDVCRTVGFFGITGHGIADDLQERLDHAARQFFAQPDEMKSEVSMARAGTAWRGWFPVEGELTSGRPDRKEGLYFGAEHPQDHPRVLALTPLHGPNQFPDSVPDLRPAVLEWLDTLRPVADAVMWASPSGSDCLLAGSRNTSLVIRRCCSGSSTIHPKRRPMGRPKPPGASVNTPTTDC